MKLEDRIINENIANLDGIRKAIADLAEKLDTRRAELVELLEDKNRSRDCVFWEGFPRTFSKWGNCRSEKFKEHLGEPMEPCNGDTAPCLAFFEMKE